MKITRKILENLIKEEVNKLMSEESDLIDLLKEYKKSRFRGSMAAFDEEWKQKARERSEQLRIEINNEINSLLPKVDLAHESVLFLSLKQNRADLENMLNVAQRLKELFREAGQAKPKDISNIIGTIEDEYYQISDEDFELP